MGRRSGGGWGFSAVVVVACVSGGQTLGAVTYTDQYTLGMPTGVTSFLPTKVGPGAQVVGGGYGPGTGPGTTFNALLWTKAAPGGINLNPGPTYDYSFVDGNDGTRQIGYGSHVASGTRHALLWSGTAGSVVDLHSAAYFETFGTATNATHQVGYAIQASGTNQALMWAGSAGSVVDLHPATGFTSTRAWGVGGAQQVGNGFGSATGNNYHALLWTGSANSLVDLTPATGFTSTYALATDGSRQVGTGTGTATLNSTHAMLWSGTAASYVDLHPGPSYADSAAHGINGNRQVGYAQPFGGSPHAMVWSGTAASFIDLHTVLPLSLTRSYAYGIDGDTVYGYALDSTNKYHAITWTLPEPGSLALGVTCVTGLLARRRR